MENSQSKPDISPSLLSFGQQHNWFQWHHWMPGSLLMYVRCPSSAILEIPQKCDFALRSPTLLVKPPLKKKHGFPEFPVSKKIRGAAIKAASKTKATEDKSSAHLRPKRSDHEANRGAAVNSEKLRRALMRPCHFIALKKWRESYQFGGGRIFEKKNLGSNKNMDQILIC